MITLQTDINFEAQSVTWRLVAGEPEYEIDGRMCHAIDATVADEQMRHILRSLGYEHVACAVKPGARGWPESHIEYWWRVLVPASEPAS